MSKLPATTIPKTCPWSGGRPVPARPGLTYPGSATIPVQVPQETGFFVAEGSIVRKIWGEGDVVLFIFAGAAAEFALNKSVDWLYFTGKLPSDPLGRLFTTVGYARKIVFAPLTEALRSIDTIRRIHEQVEASRAARIPEWAYRDVLFMLVHYSIAAYELFHRPLDNAEKQEVYDVFYRVGNRMGIPELPASYEDWLPVRQAHLKANLQRSAYTGDLFKQYRKHLGWLRYGILLEGQKLIVPEQVKELMGFGPVPWLKAVISAYRMCKALGISRPLRNLLLPAAYKEEIEGLDRVA